MIPYLHGLHRRIGSTAGAIVLIAALFIGWPASSLAQAPGADVGGLGGEDTFINDFRTPGEPSMTVYIWGSVGNPGIWRVNRDVDFIRLLSAAGVPGLGQDDPETRTRVNIRVYRQDGTDRRKIYEERVNEILERGRNIPDVRDGDVIEVETERRRSATSQFQFITSVLGSGASLALLIFRLVEGRP